MRQVRIKERDDLGTMVEKISDGNPDAARALRSMVRITDAVDPSCLEGRYFCLLQADMLGLYGADMQVLFDRVCGGDPVRTLAVLRAVQIGLVEADALRKTLDLLAASDSGRLTRRVRLAVGGYAPVAPVDAGVPKPSI